MMSDAPPENPVAPPRSRELSGRWVVVGMLLFGVTATSILYLYWRLHTAPFLPLQQALADRFEDSRPRVEGGQRKIHQNTPRILRIIIKVDFNPQTSEQKVQSLVREIAEVAADYQELDQYQLLEVCLFWPEPQGLIHERTLELSLPELEVQESSSRELPPTTGG